VKNLKIDTGNIRTLSRGKAWIWEPEISQAPVVITCKKSVHLLQRHKRKYANADMGEKSFYFKGPGNKLNLKAQNLTIFKQIAAGVDDETWLFHLKKHEYSKWFMDEMHDEELSALVYEVESTVPDAASSKQTIIHLIEERYTA
jgi:hypothetical protein